MVYSSVIFVLAWSAILLVSTLLTPTSCRQIIFARRRECGPKSGKSQPSASAALFRASRAEESGGEGGDTAVLLRGPFRRAILRREVPANSRYPCSTKRPLNWDSLLFQPPIPRQVAQMPFDFLVALPRSEERRVGKEC